MNPADVRDVVAITSSVLSTPIDALLDREFSDVLSWYARAMQIRRRS